MTIDPKNQQARSIQAALLARTGHEFMVSNILLLDMDAKQKKLASGEAFSFAFPDEGDDLLGAVPSYDVPAFAGIVNTTPHEVTVYSPDTPDTLPAPAPAPVVRYAPVIFPVARAAQTRRDVGALEGVPVGVSEYGTLEGLPAPRPGVWFIVSGLVLASAPDRPDLLAPARPVRDGQGRVVGCRAFDTTPAGAAVLAPKPESSSTLTSGDTWELWASAPETPVCGEAPLPSPFRTLQNVIVIDERKGATYYGDIHISNDVWVVKPRREKRGRQWETYPFGEKRYDQTAPKFAFVKMRVHEAVDNSKVIEGGFDYADFAAERWNIGELICKNYQ